ncbi:hypothetical protein HMPREF9333_00334 [Johnsonella ignava ATCC 51276]|jgi:hypothetical protein|uniref:HPr domain-containing protein n=1 Tax=Johnsonella ignava ATCC 51276 TaxID=679200 RepID=G5GFJ5_9FIRM|nr:HPr family phosphocarrier protein [Johnsonella ignava]EHI56472.1 hypothetical protein HMPREF9333_00334 [Johnsonella ignava ATCC 51276]
MVSRKITIINPSGLHLRPAGNLCKESLKYKSKIKINFGDKSANAKSVLSVLGVCIKFGDEIEFVCEGTDEEEALEAVCTLADDGFGENE